MCHNETGNSLFHFHFLPNIEAQSPIPKCLVLWDKDVDFMIFCKFPNARHSEFQVEIIDHDQIKIIVLR